ncbi:hypothetical protein LTR47_001471 [Exophiala xenobiotica]|nr:hypothetical protein LTR41_003363 [Exophiala xenobiotica]KAK5237205.1 hypothetical protein LTR47_001471 [Exophiala xenobiotica]KAK5248750.1 hypothetical protein LTS06_006304 [Exophiala xenobiotica]KAK5261884.1 hypothetical protein LTR40_001405 [Exophiala xenobiotica]KAK5331641.1 hypothetical protein LTR93_000646 [Exophiala xenobiotica]
MLTLSQSAAPSVLKSSKAPQAEIGMSNSVIRLTDFQMQRAEKQLSKDTWVKETEPYSITSPSEERTNVSVRSLLDDGPRRERSLSNAFGGPISTVSHEHFPALGAKAAANPNVDTKSQANTHNLINFDDPVKDMARLNISQPPLQARQGNAWNARNEPGPDEFENALGLRGWLNSVNSTTNPPSDNHSEVASLYNRRVPESVVSSNFIPPSVRAADPNPAANFKRLITMPAHSIISSTNRLEFERFWDSLRQEYVCPGEKCHRGFKTRLDFQKHLLSSAHVGGSVTCPSCLKKFATTTAWVAHCESASKKCDIRNSADFNNVMREVTGGVLGTSGFLDDGTVKYVAPEIQEW